ncbi:chorismate synthase [Candidatus Shikimatogenerans bostrichidophilus]|uniref:chorismate synthase n=1 Tax=Candidatus Shikimatogenerans bostrichidophilus TaxID=2943807 RepID=UPI002965D2AC
MGGNTFGNIFKITTFGESHGVAVGGIIDGCPSCIKININKINKELNRRKTGQSKIVTPRKEKDKIEILSGILNNITTGTPIGFIVYNKDIKSKDYNNIKNIYRPSHADFTYYKKYNIRDYRGGGRSSARETVCRVIAGSIAKQIIKKKNIKIYAYVSSVGNIKLNKSYKKIKIKNIEKNIIRCPDNKIAKKMIKKIEKIKNEGDSIGGIITCVIKNVPIGLGEPVFNKLHSELGKAMLSINAVKGFEYGCGFKGTKKKGSQLNDQLNEKEKTNTNNSGGIQGGISNGMEIYFNVAFKPVSTIKKEQYSINKNKEKVKIKIKGRHDPCVLPRAVPIVEAMASLVILDYYLLNNLYNIFK